MTTFSYASLALSPAGMVYLNEQALRLCVYEGRNLLAVGTPDDVQFYDAEQVIRDLQGSASEFDLPLPEPVEMPVMAKLDARGARFVREFALGADQNYLKTTVPLDYPDLILGNLKSMGLVIQKPSMFKLLSAEVQEKTAAALRARVLNDKSNDLIKDYVAEPEPEDGQPEIPMGVVYKLPPAVYERVLRNTGGASPITTRIKWPFNTMQIGDAVLIDAKLAKRAQTAVHVYAARMGRSFKTTTNKITRVLQVVRVEDKE